MEPAVAKLAVEAAAGEPTDLAFLHERDATAGDRNKEVGILRVHLHSPTPTSCQSEINAIQGCLRNLGAALLKCMKVRQLEQRGWEAEVKTSVATGQSVGLLANGLAIGR